MIVKFTFEITDKSLGVTERQNWQFTEEEIRKPIFHKFLIHLINQFNENTFINPQNKIETDR